MAGERVLFAFIDGQLAGRFTETGVGSARFDYTPEYSGTPLSLSLPIGGPISDTAPFNYLDNLLPDNPDARLRLASIHHSRPDVFSLLSDLGEDVAGAVTLTNQATLPSREPRMLREATDDDIAYWVGTLKRDPTAPPPAWVETRWSLAGQQAKFSLANIESMWFWSTWETPSTHIFKPEWEEHRKAERAELECLRLAGECGLLATEASIMTFAEESTLAVKRWDRTDMGKRLSAEDMMQALGLPGREKYEVPADVIIAKLRACNQEWPFVQQMLFNLAIGNVDAHAKNYSVLFDDDNVRLAPIYDTVPIFLWPQYPQTPAVFLGRNPGLTFDSDADWIMFAHACQLDPEHLLHEMRTIFAFVAERLPDVFSGDGFDPGDKDVAARFVSTRLEKLLPRPARVRHPLIVAHEQHNLAMRPQGGSELPTSTVT